MKAQVLTEMPENELNDLLVTEKERLIKMKMSHAVSPIENPLQIKFTRKTIARVMTEISKRRNTSK
jgi:large subunit ribosomal protein L29